MRGKGGNGERDCSIEAGLSLCPWQEKERENAKWRKRESRCGSLVFPDDYRAHCFRASSRFRGLFAVLAATRASIIDDEVVSHPLRASANDKPLLRPQRLVASLLRSFGAAAGSGT